MRKSRGKFIVLEGLEGVGKSTNSAFIENFLKSRGVDLVVTREPGGTDLGEEIRDLLLRKRREAVDEVAELLLIFSARAQHLARRIIPALEAGQWVLCDRFIDSTYAYQGGGRGLDTSLVDTLKELVLKDFQPDLTFYLDIDVRLGLSRASQRDALDRFESEQIDFFERSRAVYLQRIAENPERYRVIDASRNLDKIQADISEILLAWQ
ncbi:MAG: dTMP kinase [Cellvibrionaceae bacterium]|jgi:dTMP kinase